MNLDDLAGMQTVDKRNMIEVIRSLPDQMKEALQSTSRLGVSRSASDEIVFAGVGGSAIVGDIARSWLMDSLGLPIMVVRGDTPPAFVDEDSFVIAVSYSGNTSETIECLRSALSRGCMVACVSSGGEIQSICEKRNLPLAKVPKGMPPRGAIGYLFVSAYLILEEMGVTVSREEMENTIVHLREIRSKLDPSVGLGENVAKKISEKISDRTPLIYAGRRLSPIARRWKTQLNENSKKMAWWGSLPEINHNEIVGWDKEDDVGRFVAIVLRDDEEGELEKKRNDETVRLISKKAEVIQVYVEGETRLARMFHCLMLGDYVSYYCAVRRDMNPTPVDAIDRLKKRLQGCDER